MRDGFAVLRTGYLRPLLWPNHRLIRARCTVYCPCQEIPREPFEPFGVRFVFHLPIQLILYLLLAFIAKTPLLTKRG
jgi:hypothetical protein